MQIHITHNLPNGNRRNETLVFDAGDPIRKTAALEGVSRAVVALAKITGEDFSFSVTW